MTSDRYNGTVRLRRQHGMRGYGIYCRIIELIQTSPDGRIVYDVDDLVYDMREDAAIIKEVVESYGLFDIVDGNLEDPYSKTPEAIAEAIEKQKAANRSKAAKKAAATRKARREQEKNQERETAATNDARLAVHERDAAELSPKQQTRFNPQIEDGEVDELAERDEKSELFDAVRDAWNKVFERTYRVNHDLQPSAICWQNFSDSSKTYGYQDYVDAFRAARYDKFAWQFQDVLKPANMRRLLSQVEIERQAEAVKRKQDEPKLTYEQREMIEYADAKGWNWDNR